MFFSKNRFSADKAVLDDFFPVLLSYIGVLGLHVQVTMCHTNMNRNLHGRVLALLKEKETKNKPHQHIALLGNEPVSITAYLGIVKKSCVGGEFLLYIFQHVTRYA